MAVKTFNVLSIDAWRDPEGGWTWNQWFQAGKLTIEANDLSNNRKVLKALRDEGILGLMTGGQVAVEDDGNNIVVMWKGTREPLFAIEYGPVLN
jgi:hypothetical protein